jgi:hypothetical protein
MVVVSLAKLPIFPEAHAISDDDAVSSAMVISVC